MLGAPGGERRGKDTKRKSRNEKKNSSPPPNFSRKKKSSGCSSVGGSEGCPHPLSYPREKVGFVRVLLKILRGDIDGVGEVK